MIYNLDHLDHLDHLGHLDHLQDIPHLSLRDIMLDLYTKNTDPTGETCARSDGSYGSHPVTWLGHRTRR